jgi:hypothetical protein
MKPNSIFGDAYSDDPGHLYPELIGMQVTSSIVTTAQCVYVYVDIRIHTYASFTHMCAKYTCMLSSQM